MYDIVLVDKDMSFIEVLETAINKEEDIKVIGRAYDGEMAIQTICDLRPDVIVIDPSLEKLDGLHIIRQIHSSKTFSPMFYVLSSFATDSYLRMLNQLNVDLFSIKPINAELVIQNIRQLMNSNILPKGMDSYISAAKIDMDQLENSVNQLLESLGLSSYLTSTKRTKEAIIACVLDDTLLENVNSHLYEYLAEKHATTRYAIERNIRNSIHWIIDQKTDTYSILFGEQKLTNKAFLNIIAISIRKALL